MTQELQEIEKQKTEAVPKLRFRDYSGNFQNQKLHDLIKELNSGVSVNSEDFPIQSKTEAGILKTNCVSKGGFFAGENKKILSEELSRSRLNPKKGEIIISRMNTPQLVGESGYVNKDLQNLFIPDRLWQTVIDHNRCNSRWLSYFLITNKVRHNLKAIATGTSGTMKNISKPNFLVMKVQIPSLPEQQKIASFLSAADKKIQQLSRKKELLETYKKGVMQQLFSQEIRFKDEDGKEFPEWEEKKLREIAAFSKGKGISKNDVSMDGETPCIRYGELYTVYKETIDITHSKTNLLKKHLTLSEAGDVIIPASGETRIDIATASCVLQNGIGLGGDLNIIRGNFNGVFLAYYLNGHLKNDIAKLSQGSSVMHLYSSQLKNLKLEIPCIQEQQKIAGFLSAIDKKFEAVSEEISQTQSFKKGLLQQMFV
ncbi:restriction endonuclease subunit S [Zunongwangia sp. F260]|uniref:Restriction endonuclease subunit S n=1 Tax=Autumnicola lenta TaxID=3075593 RepID=A0ABU3CHR9_9FLAO|nr:restriction endonuclease subunit S [Zunongwangia sp. F260]MDT0645892.1 restriction endonuclease subunit S [Zunongwangia sp. F260]